MTHRNYKKIGSYFTRIKMTNVRAGKYAICICMWMLRSGVASDYIILVILYIRQGRPSGIGPISEPDWIMGDR